MSQPENETSTPPELPVKPAPVGGTARFPVKTLVMTCVVGGLIMIARFYRSEFEETLGLSPDVLQVSSWLLIMLTIVVWMIWILCLSGRPWPVRILMFALFFGIPWAFLNILRPVNNGDTGIARFEPIWKKRKVIAADVEGTSVPVDLKTETPNDFPGFLGPARNGTTPKQAAISDDALADAEIVWKQGIGEGWSGFAARNGYAVTMEQRGDMECVVCYDIETGNLQWIYKHKTRHRDAMGIGGIGPRSTPTIDGGMVYAVGAMGNLVCLNGTDGAVVWQQDLPEILEIEILTGNRDGFKYQYESSTLAWGRSGSPLVVENLVIVPGGGPRLDPPALNSQSEIFATLLAFDRSSGELVWKAGNDMIAYGSPSLVTLAGKPQVVIVAEARALGFDPQTGTQLWAHDRPGSSEGPANCSQVSLVDESTVLLTKGYNMGGELVEISEEDGNWTAFSIEANSRALKTKLTSPVIFDGYSFSLSDGFLECADLEDLSRKWKHRGHFGHGQLLLCGDKLLVHSESGSLLLVKASPDGYEELGKMKTIRGVCWNTLCRYGEYLLVRSEIEAACIRLIEE